MRALLDACVLYPTVLREILLGVAARGLYAPLWSERILEEWARTAARHDPANEAIARGEIALLKAGWPGAMTGEGDVRALDLPDAGDLHVLASAIAGKAEVIVTFNLRDFPARGLVHHGIVARHPDDFLMQLWLRDSGAVEAAVEEVRQRTEAISGRPQPIRPLLKRLRLPRLGKALSG